MRKAVRYRLRGPFAANVKSCKIRPAGGSPSMRGSGPVSAAHRRPDWPRAHVGLARTPARIGRRDQRLQVRPTGRPSDRWEAARQTDDGLFDALASTCRITRSVDAGSVQPMIDGGQRLVGQALSIPPSNGRRIASHGRSGKRGETPNPAPPVEKYLVITMACREIRRQGAQPAKSRGGAPYRCCNPLSQNVFGSV
jgi:hypothetical protein